MLYHLASVVEREMEGTIVLLRWHIEHGVCEDHLADSAETATAEFVLYCLLHHIVKSSIFDRQLDIFEFEEASVLLNEGVLRLCKDTLERVCIEWIEVGNYRQPSEQFRNESESAEIL